MTIDLSEIHGVFFEECLEGLNVMESGLLNLDQGTDIEDINSIFRAAHSIKGGSATFGFMEISAFTHVMETLLDEMRDGRRTVTRDGVDLLLESVDVLRGMVDAVRGNEEVDKTRVAEVQEKLMCMLAGESSLSTGDAAQPLAMAGADDAAGAAKGARAGQQVASDIVSGKTSAGVAGWQISFRPHPGLLKNGNEPARIFRELQALGDLETEADLSGLPGLGEIDPQQCYLGWMLTLHGDVAPGDIEELFSWVVDECELEIIPLDVPEPVSAGDAVPPAAAAMPQTPAARAGAPAATAGPGQKPAAGNRDSGSIRVAIDKVDELINLVGELVITQSMLSEIGSNVRCKDSGVLDKLRDGLSQLERNTRELQQNVLQIRMLPISFTFSRFPRLVRDLSSKLEKQVELVLVGEKTEVDKTVLEKIGDPLVHLVRNSLDHGLETPAVRKAAGKPETGRLELCAYHEGGDIIIKVIDDGAGLHRDRIRAKAIERGLITKDDDLTDERVYNLIFQAGFSTAEQVSDVSGRGVGMDVVRRNIRDLGGNVTITSTPGAGSAVTIRLPLTLAILDGQLMRVGRETYIVSLINIVESIQVHPESLGRITGQAELYKLREAYIPIIRLNRLFGMQSGIEDLQQGLLVVVESDGQQVGLFVDDLMGQQQVVIKSLETNFRQIQGVSGATILGDGTVALILDVPGLIQRYYMMCNKTGAAVADVA